jgi:hypothetical protein
MRKPVLTLGPDFAEYPSEWWGSEDWKQVAGRNQPINESLPVAPPQRMLPDGFRLFPGQRAPKTKGERAVEEIRSSRR